MLITFDELFEMWKEMIDMISDRIKDGTIKIDGCKYDMEAFVRPFFGDDDDMYDYFIEKIGSDDELLKKC